MHIAWGLRPTYKHSLAHMTCLSLSLFHKVWSFCTLVHSKNEQTNNQVKKKMITNSKGQIERWAWFFFLGVFSIKIWSLIITLCRVKACKGSPFINCNQYSISLFHHDSNPKSFGNNYDNSKLVTLRKME